MSPTQQHFEHTADTISAMKFYPGGPGVRAEVLDLLTLLVRTAEDLEWFRRTLRDRVTEWPGLAELRAIYCTSRKPRDGVEAVSGLPGFTGADLENDYQRRITAENEQRLLRWKAEEPKQLTGSIDDSIEALVHQKRVGAPVQTKPPKPAPDPEAETRRARIADELDRLRGKRAIGAATEGSTACK